MNDDRKESQLAWGLEKSGNTESGSVHWDLPTPTLYEQAIIRREGLLSHLVPLAVRTGHHTGEITQ